MPRQRRNGSNTQDSLRPLLLKTEGQAYARVTRLLGNCQVEAFCFDGQARRCIIRGSMRRRVWIAVGDMILVGLRDFQDGTADVIHKYSETEARQLVANGDVPFSALGGQQEDDAIKFTSEESDDDVNVDDI